MSANGLEMIYLENRAKLVRFLVLRGAGDQAEDLVNDLWLKIMNTTSGPISNPVAYLYRAADTLMIDRYRSRQRTERRDREWIDNEEQDVLAQPSAERSVAAQQELERVAKTLAGLGPRRELIFRKARLEGVPQKQIAADLGVSLGTVENDLRIACQALVGLKEQLR